MITDIRALEVKAASRRNLSVKAAVSAVGVVRSQGPVRQVVRFVWHFVQMAIAMVIGMAPPVLSALGLSQLVTRSPEASALEMTVAMVLPMAAWMLIRRHGWERTAEMAGAMTVPVFVLAAGSLVGLLPHTAAAFAMNILMWVAMLGAMLFRPASSLTLWPSSSTSTCAGADEDSRRWPDLRVRRCSL